MDHGVGPLFLSGFLGGCQFLFQRGQVRVFQLGGLFVFQTGLGLLDLALQLLQLPGFSPTGASAAWRRMMFTPMLANRSAILSAVS